MKKETRKTEKYVTERTFEKSMASIAKSFARVDESLTAHGKALETIINGIKNIHEDNKYFRSSISSSASDISSHDRKIENLLMRIERLEQKLK